MLRVLTVAGALLVIAQLHRASGGVVSSALNQTFGLGAPDIGLVIGAMMLASAVVQLPAGLAFDRFGTRSTVSAMALVALLGSYMPAESAAALGVLIATRGLLPPLVGMPVMWPYLSSVVGEARRWRAALGKVE